MGARMKKRSIANGVFTLVAFLVLAGCTSNANGPDSGASSSEGGSEPWRKVVETNERFADALKADDFDNLCSAARIAIEAEFSFETVDGNFDRVDDATSCNGTTMTDEDGEGPYLTIEVRFTSLEGFRQEVAEVIMDNGDKATECDLTDVVADFSSRDGEVGDLADVEGNQYCVYNVDGSSPDDGFRRGAFIARDTLISVRAKDIEDDTSVDDSRTESEAAVKAILPELREKI